MTSLRESLAAQAQIDDIKFWATSASGPGGARRLAMYTGIGVEGAYTEDLGSDARVEQLTATVDEDVYSALKLKRDAGNTVQAVHPLFGVFTARMEMTYQAGPDDLVDVSITLTEHGEPTIFLPSQTITLSGKAQDTSSAFDALSLQGSTLGGLDGATSALTDSWDAFDTGWDAFDSVVENALGGDVLWDEMSAAFGDLANLGDDLINQVDNAWNDVAGLVDLAIEDGVYSVINGARGIVDAMEQQVSAVWQDFQVVNPVSIAEVALDLIGDAGDDVIDQILDRNPGIVDILAVPAGIQVSIPVLL